MVSQVRPQEETQERLKKTKLIILTGPRNTAHQTGPHGRGTRRSRGRRQERRKSRAFTGVSVGKARHDRVSCLGLASWNNFSGLYVATRVVSNCLVPGSGMIKAEECFLLRYMGQIQEVGLWLAQFAFQIYAPGWTLCYL